MEINIELILYTWVIGILYCSFANVLFFCQDFIRILMNLEIMMLANCFLLVIMSFLNPELPCDELIAAIPLLIAVAAADAAIGLGILVVIFKHKNSVLLKHFERLTG